jgi:hypothetical protein
MGTSKKKMKPFPPVNHVLSSAPCGPKLYISVNYDIEIHFVALFSSSSSIFCFSFPFSLIAIVFLTCEKQTF